MIFFEQIVHSSTYLLSLDRLLLRSRTDRDKYIYKVMLAEGLVLGSIGRLIHKKILKMRESVSAA